jgi:hypothetical protein
MAKVGSEGEGAITPNRHRLYGELFAELSQPKW